MTTVAKAIALSAIPNYSIPDLLYAYGLYIMNNSYRFVRYPLPLSPTSIVGSYENLLILRDAVHFVNRMGVVFVASRGQNSQNQFTYPACYNDDWVINVSGSDAAGHWDHDQNNPRDIGGGIDIIAPSEIALTQTTEYNLSNGTSSYINVSGTSPSAAYVSGVAALLLSYADSLLVDTLNAPFENPNNLLPEDVEHVLEKTAFVLDSGYNDSEYVGAGRLNAGAALYYIKKPQRRIQHIRNWTTQPISSQIALVDTSVLIKLREPLTDWWNTGSYIDSTFPSIKLDTGFYKADVFLFKQKMPNALAAEDSILDYWALPSNSMTYGIYQLDTANGEKVLQPFEKDYIDSVTHTSAVVYGYFYKIFDAITDSFIGWLPFDTSVQQKYLAYSLLIENTLLTDVKKIEAEKLSAYLYPNPADNFSFLSIYVSRPQNITVKIFDITGRQISTVFNGSVNESYLIAIPVSIYEFGMYFVTVGSKYETKAFQLIKM